MYTECDLILSDTINKSSEQDKSISFHNKKN